MTTLKLTNGELEFVILKDKEAQAQNLSNRLKLWKRDWVLNEESGIDWITLLGTKDVSKNRLKNLIKKELLKEKKVKNVTLIEIEIDKETWEYLINFQCESIYGSIEAAA